MNPVFEAADQFAEGLRAVGVGVTRVTHSTNRFWQHSAYIELGAGGTIRISEHDCNTDYRVNEQQLSPTSLPSPAEWLERRKAAVEARLVQKAESLRIGAQNAQAHAAEEARIAKRQVAADRHIVAAGWASRSELAAMLKAPRKTLRQQAWKELGL